MKKYISLVIVFSVLFISCSDDFLNDPKPTASVSEEEVYSNAESAQSQITGILRMFRGEFLNVDAAGVYSTYMARTVKGNDIILGFMWYLFDYAHDNREPNYYRTSFAWEYPYYMISQCNNLIKGVNNSEGITEAQKKRLLAQGKAIRAYFYFQLAMEFQHTYTKNPNSPAPPIYTEPTIEPKGMSTLQEMYDLIVSDLTYATANLDDSRLSKSYINQKVANGILARVYQVIENWEGAETAAIAAYGGQPESVLFGLIVTMMALIKLKTKNGCGGLNKEQINQPITTWRLMLLPTIYL